LGHHIALASNRADHDGLSVARRVVRIPLAEMFVLLFAADKGFVDSTTPINLANSLSFIAARMRWHIYQAVFSFLKPMIR